MNVSLYKMLRKIAGKIVRSLKYFGYRYYCPLCRRHARIFTPIAEYPGQPTIDKYEIIAMGKNPHYRCPWCNSSDKERLVWMFLSQKTDFLTTNEPLSILHIAPERNTRNYFKSRPNTTYVSGDKFEGATKYTPEHYGGAQYLDITNINFPENTFDLIICNHVLEHVPDDMQGMRELRRVLKVNGTAILQVPVSQLLDKNVEDPAANTPEKRIAAFGQDDHVRIYSEKEYLARLKEAGFIPTIHPASGFLSEEKIKLLGINRKESVYIARKQQL